MNSKTHTDSDRATDLPLALLCRGMATDQSLAAAFAALERFPYASRVLRFETQDSLSVLIAITADEGHGHWELTRVRDDLLIMVTDLIGHHPWAEFAPPNGLVQFNFILSGEMSYRVSRRGPEHSDHPALEVWRAAELNAMYPLAAPNSPERRVTISARPEFLREQFLPGNGEVSPTLQALFSMSAGGSADYELPLNPQMNAITTKLVENRYEGALHLTYVEALSLELLCLSMANLERLSEWPVPCIQDASGRS